MQKLPASDDSLLVRTDFSDEEAWQSLCREVQQPVGEFQASMRFVNDRAFEGASVGELVDRGIDAGKSFLLVADRRAMGRPEHQVLAIDILHDPGCSFRFVPSVAWSVENNLSLANMDFAEFARAVGEDGVFRGFT